MTAHPTVSSPFEGRPAQRGFTLIEVLVVVTILALTVRVVLVNYGAIVPSARLDAEASRLVGAIEGARTEAILQGKELEFELDLELNRFRIVLPPEMRVDVDQEEPEELAFDWDYLDEGVDLFGYVRVGGGPNGGGDIRDGRVRIAIDHNGFMPDQVLLLRNKAEQLQDMVWSIQFRGLERGADILTSNEGEEQLPAVAQEFAFQ